MNEHSPNLEDSVRDEIKLYNKVNRPYKLFKKLIAPVIYSFGLGTIAGLGLTSNASAQERQIQSTNKVVKVGDKKEKKPQIEFDLNGYTPAQTTVDSTVVSDTTTSFVPMDSIKVPKDSLDKEVGKLFDDGMYHTTFSRFLLLPDSIKVVNGEIHYGLVQVGKNYHPKTHRFSADNPNWKSSTWPQLSNELEWTDNKIKQRMAVNYVGIDTSKIDVQRDANGNVIDIFCYDTNPKFQKGIVQHNSPTGYTNRKKHKLILENEVVYLSEQDIEKIAKENYFKKNIARQLVRESKTKTITKIIRKPVEVAKYALGNSYVGLGASSQGNDGPHTGLTNTELGILIPNKNWGVLARAEAGSGYNEGGNLEGFLRVSPGENLNLFLGGNTYVLPSDLDYLTDFSREKSVSGGLFANVPYLLLGVEGTNYTASSVNAATAASAAGHANVFAGIGRGKENSPLMFGRLMLPFDDVKGKEYGLGFGLGLKPKDVAERLMLEGKYKTSNLNFLTAATQGNHVFADLSIRNNDEVDAGLGTPGNAGGTFEKFDLGARIGRFYTTARLDHTPGNAYTLQDSVEIAPGFWIRLQPTTVEIRDIFSGKLNLGYNFTDNFAMGVELGEENLQKFKENFSVGLDANYRVNMGKHKK